MLRDFFRSSPVRDGGLVGGTTILSLTLGVGLYAVLSGDNLWDKNTISPILALGLITGVAFGLLSALLRSLLADRSGKIQVVERLTWTRQSLWNSLKSREHLKNVLLIGILLLVTAGWFMLLVLWSSPSTPDQKAFMTGLIIILCIGFSGSALYWLIFGLLQGVSSGQLNEREHIVPNQGIHRSAWNGLLFGFIGGGVCLLVCILSIVFGFVLLFVSLTWINNSGNNTASLSSSPSGLENIDISSFLPAILVFAFASCLVIALQIGWLACLRHYLLRWLLWFDGSIPWNYVRFLDYAVERLLLRKAGGGYIFMHRLLLDYLASLDTSLIGKETSVIPAMKRTPTDLSQTSTIHQRGTTGHKIGAIVFVEVILLLTLTCGVSLFGEAQQHAYIVAPTATAQAQAAMNPYPSYFSEKGTLAFVDPLSQESGSQWISGKGCQFTRGAYHVSEQRSNYFKWCPASGTFSNFAFEVQLMIVQGDLWWDGFS